MTSDLRVRLAEAGLNRAEAARKSALFEEAAKVLESLCGCTPSVLWRWYVPGRIEVLGKHTDYAGGRSLLCAVERGFCVAAAPRSDALVRIADAEGKLEAQFTLSADSGGEAAGWTIYPLTVVRRVARNFSGDLRGLDLVFTSDLPSSAGLGSSSAFTVAVFEALSTANGLGQRAEFRSNIRCREDLAGYLACIENGQTFGTLAGDCGVGTHGGSEDHTAMLCCRAGQLSQYAFCPVREERTVALPRDTVFVIGVSGVAAGKTGAAREQYNRASRAACAILELWRAATGREDATLFAAATHAANGPERMREILRRSSTPQFSALELLDRLEQFLSETQHIIPAAVEALANGDFCALGEQVARSQAGAEQLLGNQIPETIELACSARRLGAIAASAFGAGFGGSVWALVRSEQGGDFRAAWEEHYRRQFPGVAQASQFFLSGAGPALLQL